MTPEEQHRHWQEGHKYALECMKALLWLNGGTAIALLTFFGNRAKMLSTTSTDATFFSVGTVGSVLVFVFAYVAQLQYGNRGYSALPWAWHKAAYVALLAAIGGFIGGIWFSKIAVVTALT